MAKILALSFRFPCPLTDGARIRIYHLCRLLSQEHDVDLLSLNEGPLGSGALSGVESVFKNVEAFPFHPLRFKLNALKGIVSHDSLQPHYHYFRKVQRWLDQNWSRYDAVLCFHIRMARYVERGMRADHVRRIPKLIDLIDATSLNYREAQERARGVWRVVLPVENRRALAYELRVLKLFDKAFVTSAHDKAYLEQHAGQNLEKLVVLPNGVRDELFERPPVRNEDDSIVFLGKMDYAPNVDAVLFFAQEVFPKVRESHPGAEFVIVGASPSKEVLKLRERPGIKVTGYVEDPYSYVERAKIVVAPLRFSAGIQNKILEAMALRKAIVTTSKGARGIAGFRAGCLAVADDPLQMSQLILQLWDDAGTRRKMGEMAWQLVKQRYRWEIVGVRLLEEVEKVFS